jgi:hypothetical protein
MNSNFFDHNSVGKEVEIFEDVKKVEQKPQSRKTKAQRN